MSQKKNKQTNYSINHLCSLITACCGKDRQKADEIIITFLAQAVLEIADEWAAHDKTISANIMTRLNDILTESKTGITVDESGDNVITIDNFLDEKKV